MKAGLLSSPMRIWTYCADGGINQASNASQTRLWAANSLPAQAERSSRENPQEPER